MLIELKPKFMVIDANQAFARFLRLDKPTYALVRWQKERPGLSLGIGWSR